jgi:hypothetical protein
MKGFNIMDTTIDDKVIMSEDMSEITVIRETPDETQEVTENEFGIDTSTMPVEVKSAFDKMLETLKAQTATLKDLQESKANFEATLQKREPVITENVDEPVRLRDQLKFEEGDYYAKFFLPIADAIDNIQGKIDALGGTVADTRKETYTEKVKTFFKNNPVDKPIVKKMDEIATRLGGNSYQDLDRLMLYAKAELGISDKPKVTTNPRNQVEQGKIRKTVTEPIKVNSMQDAFKKALQSMEE